MNFETNTKTTRNTVRRQHSSEGAVPQEEPIDIQPIDHVVITEGDPICLR